MKAIVCPRYGSPDVLRAQDVVMPEPRRGQVLVEVRAASINAADWHVMRGDPFVFRAAMGLLRPKYPVLGADVSGKVVAIGPGVTRFAVGDELFGDLAACGFGAFAQFACADEEALIHKPPSLSHAHAAAIPLASVTALKGLRDVGKLREGQRVLVHGASGGVGSYAVQIAKALGADVTAAAAGAKLDMVRTLGADRVVDLAKEDVTRGEPYDIVFDTAAFRPILDFRRVLKPEGVYALAGGTFGAFLRAMFIGPLFKVFGAQRYEVVMSKPDRHDLALVTALATSGKVTPFIDREFPLEGVPDAIRYMEARRVRGKLVIAV